MAKKEVKSFDFSKLMGIIGEASKKTSIMIDNSKEKATFINTGVYTLNALLSKSIKYGGVPKSRITVFAGPPGVGKSYICYNIAKNAQKEGYNIIYIDTEFSVESENLATFGVDPDNNFVLLRSNKVEDIKLFLTSMLEQLKQLKEKNEDIGKTIIFLDSVGQLASTKEIEDALEGKNKQDMSRAKAIKSLFRIINSDLGYLGIPLVCTNHVYMTQDLFPQTVMSGGEGLMYSASVIVYLSNAKLKTGEESTDSKSYVKDTGQSGVVVSAKARKNRLARPMLIKFEINHTTGTNPYMGLEEFCTFDNFETLGIARVKEEKVGKDVKFIENTSQSAKYYVKHLEKYVAEKNLFNSQVFTDEIIDKLDPIISKYFSYSSNEEREKIMKQMDDDYSKYDGDDNDDVFDIENDNDFN